MCPCDSGHGIVCDYHRQNPPDLLNEVTDDPYDDESDYGRGWADGYAAGIRDAAQPTRHQPVAGELVALQVTAIPYGGGDTRER